MKKMTLTFLLLIAATDSANSMGAEVPVSWLKSEADLPASVRAQLQDCRYLADNRAEAWDENSETGGYSVDIDGKQKLFVVTCDLAASNAFDATVLLEAENAERLSFPVFDENGEKSTRDMIGNSMMKKDLILDSRISAGCAGQIGTTATHKFANGAFELLRLESNSNCENPEWKIIYEKRP
jgi:hypothetical protein